MLKVYDREQIDEIRNKYITGINSIPPDKNEFPNSLIISMLHFYVDIIDNTAKVKIQMQIYNHHQEKTEFTYMLPFIFPHELISLSVNCNERSKETFPESESFPNIEFDDKVAEGKFSIRLNHQEPYLTFLILANFSPQTNITVTVELMSSLTVNPNYSIFQIPLIEKYNNLLYPSYSIKIDISTEKENFYDLQLEYNNENQSESIKNNKKTIYKENVSFRSIFRLKILQNREKQEQIIAIKETPDIIFFIDESSDSNTGTTILNFLKNFGTNFRFNIVRTGPNGNILSTNMCKNDEDGLDNAQKFLEESKTTNSSYNFNDCYLNIFGNESKNEEEKSPFNSGQIQKPQEKLIKGVNYHNTVAILVGSFSQDNNTPKKTMTYLIDPYHFYNSEIFAIKNNFINIDTSMGLNHAFTSLLQKLRTKTQDTNQTQEDIDVIEFYQKKLLGKITSLKHFIHKYFPKGFQCQEDTDFLINLWKTFDVDLGGFWTEKYDKKDNNKVNKQKDLLNEHDIKYVLDKEIEKEKKCSLENAKELRELFRDEEIDYYLNFKQYLFNGNIHNIEIFISYTSAYINRAFYEGIDPEIIGALVKTNEQIDKITDQYKENKKDQHLFYNLLFEKYYEVIEIIRKISAIRHRRNPNLHHIQIQTGNPIIIPKCRENNSFFPKIVSKQYITFKDDSSSSIEANGPYITSYEPTNKIDKLHHSLCEVDVIKDNNKIGKIKQQQYDPDPQYKMDKEFQKKVKEDRKQILAEYFENRKEDKILNRSNKDEKGQEEKTNFTKNINLEISTKKLESEGETATQSPIDTFGSVDLKPQIDLSYEDNDTENKLSA